MFPFIKTIRSILNARLLGLMFISAVIESPPIAVVSR
jgi:hypothetical protein